MLEKNNKITKNQTFVWLKILINIEFESKKIILKIWGDSVNKLKEKSGKTLKKR
jgi:hypothetical protein